MPKKDRILHCPFNILVDSNEGHPFTFKKIQSDANNDFRFFHVECRRANLGRYPNSLGDYAIEGAVGRFAIERKSSEDLYGTVLGFDSKDGYVGRRTRFESELANLNEIDGAAVIVEVEYGQLMQQPPDYGDKLPELNAKILARSITSYGQDYPKVQWRFMPTRRWAEIETFRQLYRWWRKHLK